MTSQPTAGASEYSAITACRICGGTNLTSVLSLGEQYLTGVFPRSPSEPLTRGPLELVWCSHCGLLQLKHSYSLSEMYGANYGYRSGLNASMVRHLEQKVHYLERLARPGARDTVIDIGSNDATLLNAYQKGPCKIGVDPTGPKFQRFYRDDTRLIPRFFSATVLDEALSGGKAKIISSIAMFYDIERPREFVRDIAACLADDGVWHFEQSYMPSMLRTNSYDTICHEHLEFYSFKVVADLLAAAGLRVIDVQMNAVNGGSFAVTA
ncbi:MAG TPA: methyltransferase domain-containing protein, partial [Gemmatimonadaceae bacterium]